MPVAYHPRYVAHFVNPLYESVTLDAAPFGSDQGADMLHDAELAGGVLPPGSTIASLLPWGDVDSFFADATSGDVDGLQLIYAAGFLLLRFNGEIDPSDYRVLHRALRTTREVLHLEEIGSIVLPDLASFMEKQSRG